MDKQKILHLTLKRKWFDEIATGHKKAEYRDLKMYWIKRLVDGLLPKTFDEVHFRNGYNKNSPFMRVKCGEIHVIGGRFRIQLGEILEIRNWDG